MRNGPNHGDAKSDRLADEVLAYLYSSLIFLLRRVDQRAVALFNEEARGTGLTLPQFHMLYVASQLGPLAQGELARQAAASEATASMVISNLIKMGLVTRTPDSSDARRKLVATTLAGDRLVEQALPAFHRSLARLNAPLGSRAQVLASLLAQLLDRAGAGVDLPEGLATHGAARIQSVHRPLNFLVRRIIQVIETDTAELLSDSGITLRQYVVLLIIALGPGISESRISSTVGLDLSNVSFIARGLRKKNLVEVNEGTRRRRYVATGDGRECLSQTEPLLVGAVRKRLRLLDETDQEPLLRMLGEVVSGDLSSSAPPDFIRISKSMQWPSFTRPAQFDQFHKGAEFDRPSRLEALLRNVASEVAARPEMLGDLDPADALLLERLLRDLAGPISNESDAARRAAKE